MACTKVINQAIAQAAIEAAKAKVLVISREGRRQSIYPKQIGVKARGPLTKAFPGTTSIQLDCKMQIPGAQECLDGGIKYILTRH